MSLAVICAECDKVISLGISGMASHLGETPDMLDTLHSVSNIHGYDGTISGAGKQTPGNSTYLCGSCLKEKLPNTFISLRG